MTHTEISSFRQVLESSRAELLGAGGTSWDRLATVAAPDEMDRLQNASDRDYAISNLERNSRRLAELAAALRRVNAGTFGECLDCDEPISPRRLAAVPWAALCIKCQEKSDRERATPTSRTEEEFSFAA